MPYLHEQYNKQDNLSDSQQKEIGPVESWTLQSDKWIHLLLNKSDLFAAGDLDCLNRPAKLIRSFEFL